MLLAWWYERRLLSPVLQVRAAVKAMFIWSLYSKGLPTHYVFGLESTCEIVQLPASEGTRYRIEIASELELTDFCVV